MTVHRARAATLLTTASQAREQAQMLEHLLHRELIAQVFEVNLGSTGSWFDGAGSRQRGRVYRESRPW